MDIIYPEKKQKEQSEVENQRRYSNNTYKIYFGKLYQSMLRYD